MHGHRCLVSMDICIGNISKSLYKDIRNCLGPNCMRTACFSVSLHSRSFCAASLTEDSQILESCDSTPHPSLHPKPYNATPPQPWIRLVRMLTRTPHLLSTPYTPSIVYMHIYIHIFIYLCPRGIVALNLKSLSHHRTDALVAIAKAKSSDGPRAQALSTLKRNIERLTGATDVPIARSSCVKFIRCFALFQEPVQQDGQSIAVADAISCGLVVLGDTAWMRGAPERLGIRVNVHALLMVKREHAPAPI